VGGKNDRGGVRQGVLGRKKIDKMKKKTSRGTLKNFHLSRRKERGKETKERQLSRGQGRCRRPEKIVGGQKGLRRKYLGGKRGKRKGTGGVGEPRTGLNRTWNS